MVADPLKEVGSETPRAQDICRGCNSGVEGRYGGGIRSGFHWLSGQQNRWQVALRHVAQVPENLGAQGLIHCVKTRCMNLKELRTVNIESKPRVRTSGGLSPGQYLRAQLADKPS